MPLEVIRDIPDARLLLGVCEVAGVQIRPASNMLRDRAASLVESLRAQGFQLDEPRRSAVRQALKGGGFSPTGRNRPAHELLLNDLAEREQAGGETMGDTPPQPGFKHISNAVDVNNITSLETMLPISLLDTGKLCGRVVIRYGREGEGYIFNQSGQYIDLKRCVAVARGEAAGELVGSPIKDSMAAKVFEGAAGLLGVVYAPASTWSREDVHKLTCNFAELLIRECDGVCEQVFCL